MGVFRNYPSTQLRAAKRRRGWVGTLAPTSSALGYGLSTAVGFDLAETETIDYGTSSSVGFDTAGGAGVDFAVATSAGFDLAETVLLDYDAATSVGFSFATPTGQVRTQVSIRERPSLRHTFDVINPKGRHKRWGPDERNPEDVPLDFTATSTMPGGYENLDVKMARDPNRAYQDLEEFSRIDIYNSAHRRVGQYRLERRPSESGQSRSVAPGGVGFQADLDDDKFARALYVDRDMSAWVGPSTGRKIGLINSNTNLGDEPTVNPDQANGNPSLQTSLTGTWARTPSSEAWYDARGLPIGHLYFSWKVGPGGQIGDDNATDTAFSWRVFLLTDDIASAFDQSANLRGAGPGTGVLDPSTGNRDWAMVALSYATAPAGGEGVTYPVFWTCLAVVGNHGLPLRGAQTATDAPGVLASDVMFHAVSTFTDLQVIRGETLKPSSFVIPHLVFKEAGSASDIVKGAARFELPDWAVWDGPGGLPTYYAADPGTFSRLWEARASESDLQEAGPQVDRIWNEVVVQYTDVDGTTRTVGPPGTTADATDATLRDSDPLNPATAAGKTRRALLQMNVSTVAGAIQTGAKWLQIQKTLDTSGDATLNGWVQDNRGIYYPVSEVRAGDYIRFPDAADHGYRKIVSHSYTDSAKTNQIKLDQPPDAMSALLERMQVVLVPLGF